jgi:hypothetical protein
MAVSPPSPLASGDQMITHDAALKKFTEATTRDDLRAGGVDLTRVLFREQEEQIQELRARVSELERATETANNRFHVSDKGSAVLKTKLEWALSQLQNQTLLYWVFDFLFALGGAILGFGVSWPGLDIQIRWIISGTGGLLLIIPFFCKLFLYLRTQTPAVNGDHREV